MTLIIFGIVLLAAVLGTFYLKDHFPETMAGPGGL